MRIVVAAERKETDVCIVKLLGKGSADVLGVGYGFSGGAGLFVSGLVYKVTDFDDKLYAVIDELLVECSNDVGRA
jgi:hypothetical protein